MYTERTKYLQNLLISPYVKVLNQISNNVELRVVFFLNKKKNVIQALDLTRKNIGIFSFCLGESDKLITHRYSKRVWFSESK